MIISQKIFDLCNILEDKKAIDITVCNTAVLKKPVDFFILATATSVAHAKSIADYVTENVQKNNMFEMCEREGLITSDWVVVDLGEGFVHIFTKEVREKYNLEKLVNEGNNIKTFDKIKKEFEKENKNKQVALKKAEKKEKKPKEKPVIEKKSVKEEKAIKKDKKTGKEKSKRERNKKDSK